MKAFSVVGYSKSGKTTTIECIIRELKSRGYKVGSVKEIHSEGFALDNDPASNSNRHRMAGAELVTARGLAETDVMFPEKLDMQRVFSFYGGYDYVVCEGVRDYPMPTIMTSATLEGLEPKWSDFAFCVSGPIADQIKGHKGVPAISAISAADALADLIEEKVFDLLPNADPSRCGACGGDCREMAMRILKGEAARSDCTTSRGTELLIGGERIKLAPFVQNVLRGAMLGIVKELHGYREGAEIELKFSIR